MGLNLLSGMSSDEHVSAEPGAGSKSGGRSGHVPGGYSADGTESKPNSSLYTQRSTTVFERPGRVDGLVFQVNGV